MTPDVASTVAGYVAWLEQNAPTMWPCGVVGVGCPAGVDINCGRPSNMYTTPSPHSTFVSSTVSCITCVLCGGERNSDHTYVHTTHVHTYTHPYTPIHTLGVALWGVFSNLCRLILSRGRRWVCLPPPPVPPDAPPWPLIGLYARHTLGSNARHLWGHHSTLEIVVIVMLYGTIIIRTW